MNTAFESRLAGNTVQMICQAPELSRSWSHVTYRRMAIVRSI